MSKASEVAIELRKLADSLDVNPDAEIGSGSLYFYYWTESAKEAFLSVSRMLLRPVKKEWPSSDNGELRVRYSSPALEVYVSIPRSLVCELVEPAKPAVYRCVPILSDEEDAALTEA